MDGRSNGRTIIHTKKTLNMAMKHEENRKSPPSIYRQSEITTTAAQTETKATSTSSSSTSSLSNHSQKAFCSL